MSTGKQNNNLSAQINDLQLMQKNVKKLTTRFKAGLFFLLFIILVTGFFVFAGVNFKMIAQAFINNYDAKQSGDILTAAEWQNLDDDFASVIDLQNAIPSGAVMAFNLAACPSGWVLADGNGVPDLRGAFIRGMYGDQNGRDVTRTLGSFQGDGFERHRHSASTGGSDSSGSTWGRAQSQGISTLYTSYNGGTETRPKNIALIYCVKQ